jgi:hypothetical protein
MNVYKQKTPLFAGLNVLLFKEPISIVPSFWSAGIPQPVSDIGKY